MSIFNKNLSNLQNQKTDAQQIDNTYANNDVDNVCYYALITSLNNYNYSNISVPIEFEEKVLVHVVSLYMDNNDFFMPPLYLAIEGPAGEGKTTQTIATLTQHDIDVLYISASQLSGNHERDPLNILEYVYNSAIQLRNKDRCVAIVIDDFHLGIVNQDDNIKKTINSNLLTGFMMNLADSSNKCRIPIILTGNDYSNVYGPLLRSGRADLFRWSPDDKIKIEIVQRVLAPITSMSDEEFLRFFEKYKNQTVSDFAQLRNDYRKKQIWSKIQHTAILNRIGLSRIKGDIKSNMNRLSYKEISELAEKRFIQENTSVEEENNND